MKFGILHSSSKSSSKSKCLRFSSVVHKRTIEEIENAHSFSAINRPIWKITDEQETELDSEYGQTKKVKQVKNVYINMENYSIPKPRVIQFLDFVNSRNPSPNSSSNSNSNSNPNPNPSPNPNLNLNSTLKKSRILPKIIQFSDFVGIEPIELAKQSELIKQAELVKKEELAERIKINRIRAEFSPLSHLADVAILDELINPIR